MKIYLLAILSIICIVNASFVYDKRLNSKRVGRDFSGSIAYGSFQYNGASCPTGAPGDTTLTGISINEVVTSGCFTDGSIAAGIVTETIGFICIPGAGGNAPHTIYFGLPSSNGFVIGGSNFVVGSGTSSSTGYSWGSIGAPSYTGPDTDGSCTGTTCSTGDFCNGPCTPQPTCTPSSGFHCTSTGTTTNYFINTATVTAPSNCGGGFQNGGCCTTNGNFPHVQGISCPIPYPNQGSQCTTPGGNSGFCAPFLDGNFCAPGGQGCGIGVGCTSDADCTNPNFPLCLSGIACNGNINDPNFCYPSFSSKKKEEIQAKRTENCPSAKICSN